jgi:hypothetical protein
LNKNDVRGFWRALILGISLVSLAILVGLIDPPTRLMQGIIMVFLLICGFSLIAYSSFNLQKANEMHLSSIMKYLSTYFGIRLLGSLLVIGSYSIGILFGVEYGFLVGAICFIVIFAFGIGLHFIADKIQ